MSVTARIKDSRDRGTSVDIVFDHLHQAITSLELRPGDKISEAEIAAQFGVSRQPVRDAFSRLENLDLLLIRPQKATEVKRFSIHEITKSRFVRASVESEVLRRAAKHCTPNDAKLLNTALADQSKVVSHGTFDEFGKLDYAFHETLCKIGKVEFASEVIAFEKANVDRLCRLSQSKGERMEELLQDHIAIADCVKSGDIDGAVKVGMIHLSRLDSTISTILDENAEYFEN